MVNIYKQELTILQQEILRLLFIKSEMIFLYDPSIFRNVFKSRKN